MTPMVEIMRFYLGSQGEVFFIFKGSGHNRFTGLGPTLCMVKGATQDTTYLMSVTGKIYQCLISR